MGRAKDGTNLIDEMSIVDIFTKLIFDADSPLDTAEQSVIELLGLVDPSVLDVSRRDVSEYLRSMGVDEMIAAVGKVKGQMDQHSLVARKAPLSGSFLRH